MMARRRGREASELIASKLTGVTIDCLSDYVRSLRGFDERHLVG